MSTPTPAQPGRVIHQRVDGEHTDGMPFELTRGGITWGTDIEIGEDDVVAMFVLEGNTMPRLWADQAFPQTGDLLQPTSIGAEGRGLIEVKVRLWQAPNLIMVGCARVDAVETPGGEAPR